MLSEFQCIYIFFFFLTYCHNEILSLEKPSFDHYCSCEIRWKDGSNKGRYIHSFMLYNSVIPYINV